MSEADIDTIEDLTAPDVNESAILIALLVHKSGGRVELTAEETERLADKLSLIIEYIGDSKVVLQTLERNESV